MFAKTLEILGNKGDVIKYVDKNGKLTKLKQYNEDGTLRYTVNPKYNKDGDIIKNDTIWNK